MPQSVKSAEVRRRTDFGMISVTNWRQMAKAIEQIVTTIPEEDWTDQVQIIGWLYQYYNSEPKDAVLLLLRRI